MMKNDNQRFVLFCFVHNTKRREKNPEKIHILEATIIEYSLFSKNK